MNQLEEICMNCVKKILNKPQEKVINLIEETISSDQDKKVP